MIGILGRIPPPEFSVVEKRCANSEKTPRKEYGPPDLSIRIKEKDISEEGVYEFRATFSSLCLAVPWVTDRYMRAHIEHIDKFVDLLCKRNLVAFRDGIGEVRVIHSPASAPVVRWMTDPDKNGVRCGCYDLSQYDGQTHIEWTLHLAKGRRLLY
jgi:hypothetical protein